MSKGQRAGCVGAAMCFVLLVGLYARVAPIAAPAAVRGAFPQATLVDPPPGATVVDKMPAGITFVEAAPPAALPNGQGVISLQKAVQVAEANFSPGDQTGVQVSASYGTHSNGEYAQRLPSGGRQPFFQRRPAWLIRYTGVSEYAVGGVYDALHPDQWLKDVHHEQNIFVDAATGQFLGGITYR